MMRIMALIFIVVLCGTELRADGRWTVLAESENGTKTYVKTNSLSLEEIVRKGETEGVLTIIGKLVTPSGQTGIFKWYVTPRDCEAEYGKIGALNMDGKLEWESDFAFGSGEVSSVMAETMCTAAKQIMLKAEDTD